MPVLGGLRDYYDYKEVRGVTKAYDEYFAEVKVNGGGFFYRCSTGPSGQFPLQRTITGSTVNKTINFR